MDIVILDISNILIIITYITISQQTNLVCCTALCAAQIQMDFPQTTRFCITRLRPFRQNMTQKISKPKPDAVLECTGCIYSFFLYPKNDDHEIPGGQYSDAMTALTPCNASEGFSSFSSSSSATARNLEMGLCFKNGGVPPVIQQYTDLVVKHG